MVRIDSPEALNSYVLKITFKRWAKLWTPGSVRLYLVERACQLENQDYRIGTVLNQLPLPTPIRTMAIGKRYSLKKKIACRTDGIESPPSSFVLECYNPGAEHVGLSLTIRSTGESVTIPFQKLIDLTPGFHRVRVSYTDICAIVNLASPFNVELVPNNDANGTTLIFGLMDFVQEDTHFDETTTACFHGSDSKIKCVVWDLDNTLWDGVLLEDGLENLTLKTGIGQILRELDQRGILQSIASKNNFAEAWAVLKHMEIAELFLAPQMSWRPKSEAIQEIAQRLNIGLNSMLFVDDSEFELQQVAAALPEVRTINARRYAEIASLDECNVPVTAESRERRRMYRLETERKTLASSFASDYIAFLRHCDIRLNIGPLSEENLERVYELTQRTNQMNFSGNRYRREMLRRVLGTSWLDTYVLEVEDRFGTYGIVGFCIVDNREPLITDLMFSCRIQSKRIEHAILGWLIRKYIAATGKDIWANYRRTERNAPSGKVFADLGMEEFANTAGVSRLVFRSDRTVPQDDDLVRIAAPHMPVSIG